MPNRTETETVWGGPQGEDAYVKVRVWTLDETITYNRMGETLKDAELVNAAARDKLSTTVLDWNWVGFDGEPLPKPLNNKDVFGQLVGVEMRWLVAALQGNSPEQLAVKKTSPK